VSQCDREFKQAKNQRLHVELTLMKLAYLNGAVQFARDLGTSNGHATNGEAKKKTSIDTGAPASASIPSATTADAAPVIEAAPRVSAAPVAAPAPRPMAPPSAVRPTATVSAPAALEEIVPVESGVEELHSTPSIEDEEADTPTFRHQVIDSSPHIDIGAPSVAGHEPATTRMPPPLPGMQKPLPTTAKLPGLASKIPSLKDLKAQVTQQMSAAKATPTADDEPSGPVTGLPIIDEEVLQRAWNDIKEDRRAQDRMSEYIVLNRPVTVDDQHVIRLAVDNPIQIDQFNAFRSEFLTELRQRTGYLRLNVHPVLVEQAPTARKLYTSADKFEYLADKFPILLDMKQKLGLDTDF